MSMVLRIIVDKAHSPAFNMAADLFLMRSCVAGNEVTLRFYEWEPASITIGRMQKASETLNMHALLKHNVAWVRRPTGGRAVLHDHDLTYSCIFPASAAEMGKNITETYGVIAQCLMAGLRRAGIPCAATDSFDQMRQTKRDVKLPCFLTPNRNEIMVQGRKLIGSAQRRTAYAVLQHGSIPITDAYRNLPDFLRLSEDQRTLQKQLLYVKSVCVREIDQRVSLSELRLALSAGFTATLPLTAEERPWAKEEQDAIKGLSDDERFHETWLSCSIP